MSTRKRKVLTLEDRVKVVQRNAKGETAIAIAKSLDVGKTQIQSIIREKASILQRWESGESGERKTKVARKCTYGDINQQVWEWFCDGRSRNIPVSGRMIQEKAVMLAQEAGDVKFSGSNGWLEKWCKRFCVKCSTLSGESGGVDQSVVDDWGKRLASICEGYKPEDIFNADETGLFFRALPTKSMVAKGDTAAGIKISKDRITVLLAASATGEKLKPLVIGKSLKPRCFKGFDINTLGITYRNNKKAWMTGVLFKEWAQSLNNKMIIQGRNILMFVDNCAAHPEMDLSNVKFVMLPPNTTSVLQPCDAGIIQTVKLHYRKCLMRYVISCMGEDPTSTGAELAKKVNLMDAIMWLKTAWNNVKETTIQRCFEKCGFKEEHIPEVEVVSDVECSEEMEEMLGTVPLDTFVNFDDDIMTRATFTIPHLEETNNEEEEEENVVDETISLRDAIQSTQKAMKFALAKGNPAMVETLWKVIKELEQNYTKAETKQTVIKDFFK